MLSLRLPALSVGQAGWILGLLALLVAFVALWWRSEIKVAEARGRAEQLAAVADSSWDALQDSLKSWADQKSASDSARDALSVELAHAKGSARVARENASRAILGARATIDALSDSLRQVTTEDLAVISAGIDSLEVVNSVCSAALATCEDLVEVSEARIWALEAQQEQTVTVARQQAATIESLQNLRGPAVGWAGYVGWAVASVLAVVMVVN